MVERREFVGAGDSRTENGGDQATERRRVGDAFEMIIDDANPHGIGLAAPVGFGGIDMAQIQKVSASEGSMSMPSTLRRPSALAPTAMITAAETMRPLSRTFTKVASIQG